MAGKPMARALFDIKSTQVPSKRFDGPTADETLDVEDDVVEVTYPSFHGLANWCDEHDRYYDGRDFCPECVENEIEPDPDLLSDEELNSVEQEYAELTLQMGMVGERYNHRDLLPDECCDRAYCVRCDNTPREAEVRYAYAI